MPPEDTVIKQGDDPQDFFFLSKGTVDVQVIDQKGEQQLVKNLEIGEYFGEIGLLYDIKRTATISCLNYCTFASLNKDEFKEMCRTYPKITKKLRIGKSRYQDNWKTFLIHCIR